MNLCADDGGGDFYYTFFHYGSCNWSIWRARKQPKKKRDKLQTVLDIIDQKKGEGKEEEED